MRQFKNIIFVSEEGKNSFLDIFPQMKEKTIECNNIVNNKEIFFIISMLLSQTFFVYLLKKIKIKTVTANTPIIIHPIG